MIVENFEYKSYKCQLKYFPNSQLFYAHADFVSGTFFYTAQEAISNLKLEMDKFLKLSINNFEELAVKICEMIEVSEGGNIEGISVNGLEILIRNFVKTYEF